MFLIQENVAFNLWQSQSIPTNNEKIMKTKLRKTLWQVNYDFGAEKHHHLCFRDFKT